MNDTIQFSIVTPEDLLKLIAASAMKHVEVALPNHATFAIEVEYRNNRTVGIHYDVEGVGVTDRRLHLEPGEIIFTNEAGRAALEARKQSCKLIVTQLRHVFGED